MLEGKGFTYRDIDTEEGSFRFIPAYREDDPVGPEFMLNETAVRSIGWTPREAIGKRMARMDRNQRGTVIAVVKDFHTRSLHREIEPVVFTLFPFGLKWLHVKLAGGDVPETIDFLHKTWNEHLPQRPFAFTFLDERLNQQVYAQEIQTERMIRVFSFLAVFVASLGLLGLVSYMAEQRTKEVGIRRTLGSSVGAVMVLLTRDYLMLVGVATLIAWPVGFYAMRDWLASFAYRDGSGDGAAN